MGYCPRQCCNHQRNLYRLYFQFLIPNILINYNFLIPTSRLKNTNLDLSFQLVKYAIYVTIRNQCVELAIDKLATKLCRQEVDVYTLLIGRDAYLVRKYI